MFDESLRKIFVKIFIFERGRELSRMVVEYLLVGQYHNRMDGVEEANLHSSFQTHSDILYIGLVTQKLFEPNFLL